MARQGDAAMSGKPDDVITQDEQLEDATPPPPVPAGVVVESPQEYLDGWNRRSSKVALEFAVVYGDPTIDFAGIVGPNEECVHCKAAGKPGVFNHQLHLKT